MFALLWQWPWGFKGLSIALSKICILNKAFFIHEGQIEIKSLFWKCVSAKAGGNT